VTGAAAVVAMVAAILALSAAMLVLEHRVHQQRTAYRQCVAGIASYVDADEMWRQEQECEMGWAP
jgi:hypothetical protein